MVSGSNDNQFRRRVAQDYPKVLPGSPVALKVQSVGETGTPTDPLQLLAPMMSFDSGVDS